MNWPNSKHALANWTGERQTRHPNRFFIRLPNNLRELTLTTLICLLCLPLPSRASAQSGTSSPETLAIPQLTRPILLRIEAMRGLAEMVPILVRVVERDGLNRALERTLTHHRTEQDWQAEERVLRRLGVLDPTQNLRQLLLAIHEARDLGLYDQHTGQVLLLEGLPISARELSLTQGLFSALQDQHWGRGRLLAGRDRANDVLFAARALLDGDALVMTLNLNLPDWANFMQMTALSSVLGQPQVSTSLVLTNDLDEPHTFLLELISLPQVSGVAFVTELYRVGGWELVDSAYLDPPLSSEQVLHPERYLQRDSPTFIELDLSFLEELGYEIIYDQITGEFTWGAVFRHVLAAELSTRSIAAAVNGWDGDRMIALQDPAGEMLLLCLTIWDSPEDARQFELVLRRLVEANTSITMRLAQLGNHGARHMLKRDHSWIIIERWGDMVLWLDGAPEARAGKAAEHWLDLIWLGRTRAPYPERDFPRGDSPADRQ